MVDCFKNWLFEYSYMNKIPRVSRGKAYIYKGTPSTLTDRQTPSSMACDLYPQKPNLQFKNGHQQTCLVEPLVVQML